MNLRIQAVRTKVESYGRIVAHESIELIRRRGLSYAALALTLTAGSLYLSGARPVLVTGGSQVPKSTADDRTLVHNQSEPLQSITGQNDTNQGSAASQGKTNEQQSRTSVSVNGTNIPVPANGEVNKTMTNGDGTTSISVSHDSSGGSSYSSLNVQVYSQNSASEEGN